MKAVITHDGTEIIITTEDSASSYGIPVVLIDGELTDISVDWHDDPPVPSPTIGSLLWARRGGWCGSLTMEVLNSEIERILSDIPYDQRRGADYDRAVDEFETEYWRRRDAELRED